MMFSQSALWFARTAVTAWVGAAVLFVVVGVSEVIHPEFDSTIRDHLVLIRFPWFYRFGFTLLVIGLLGTIGAGPAVMPPRRKQLAAGLLVITLLLMSLDYFAVYQPLAGMITPPGKTRPPEFTAYHRASMWVNLAQLVGSFAAAALLNWSGRSNSSVKPLL